MQLGSMLHHVVSLYILTYDARKHKHKLFFQFIRNDYTRYCFPFKLTPRCLDKTQKSKCLKSSTRNRSEFSSCWSRLVS